MAIYVVNQPSFYVSGCLVAFLALNRSRVKRHQVRKNSHESHSKENSQHYNNCQFKVMGFHTTQLSNIQIWVMNTKVNNFRALLGKDLQKQTQSRE